MIHFFLYKRVNPNVFGAYIQRGFLIGILREMSTIKTEHSFTITINVRFGLCQWESLSPLDLECSFPLVFVIFEVFQGYSAVFVNGRGRVASFSPLVFQFARRKTLIKIVDSWPLINCYRFIISARINVIFIHSETSRIAQTHMTHLFKESETRQCEGNERKQGNVVIDESGDIQCIFFLITRRLKVTNS